jgi:hypothetical protein
MSNIQYAINMEKRSQAHCSMVPHSERVGNCLYFQYPGMHSPDQMACLLNSHEKDTVHDRNILAAFFACTDDMLSERRSHSRLQII